MREVVMGFVNRLIGLFRRSRLEQDLNEELQCHIELKTQENIEAGMAPDEARYVALRAFGGVEQKKEECRDSDRLRLAEDLIQDLRYGLRQLRRNPGFTAVAVITLALGIGANTAIFSIVDAVLLRTLPYKNANRLVIITQRPSEERLGEVLDTYREFEEWNRYSRKLERLTAVTWFADQVWSWHGARREIGAVRISPQFFSLLGIHAAQGRTFDAEDLKKPCTVVLAHRFWQEQLGGMPGWVGKSLILNNTACTVVGIMPRSFSFYPKQAQLWRLITPDSAFAKHPWDGNVAVFGLLKPGVSRASAQTQLKGLQDRIARENSSLAALKVEPDVLDLQWEFDWLTGRNLRSSLIILFASVIFVLLIAFVNVANMLLGRATERQKELGVRAALGSGHWRLIRQLLTESVLLSLTGALLGTLVAVFCVRYINATETTHLPPGNLVTVSWQVLGFTATVAVLVGILFGLIPAWKASRLDLNAVLKESGRTASRGALSSRTSRALVVAEVALSMALLAIAGLLIQSAVRLTNAPMGYERRNLLLTYVQLPSSRYPKPADWIRFCDRLRRRITSLPGVVGVAFSPDIPNTGSHVSIESLGTEPTVTVTDQSASVDYFRVMGIPLLRGRAFNGLDRQKSLPVAIVNQDFVKEFFPKGNPLGQRIKLGKPNAKRPWRTIVGVVGNVKRYPVFKEMGTVGGPVVYVALRQHPLMWFSVYVRVAKNPRSLEPGVARAVTMVDSNLPRPDVETQNQWLAQFTAQPRFRAALLGIFCGLALLLACVGIYGVLSQLVVQRTHEIGIRMTLGALRGDVLSLVVCEGLKLIIAGIAVGTIGALSMGRLLSSFLYGVSPSDPMTLVAASLMLACVALLACYIPARRAADVDPIAALHSE
jgi:predicted permease